MKRLITLLSFVLAFAATTSKSEAQINLQPIIVQSYIPTGACQLGSQSTIVMVTQNVAGTGAGLYQCIAGSWAYYNPFTTSGGATTPATTALLQGNGTANGVIAANGPTAITALLGTGATAVTNLGITLDQIPAGFTINSFSTSIPATVEVGASYASPTYTAAYSASPSPSPTVSNNCGQATTTLTAPYTSGSLTGTFSLTSAGSCVFTLSATATSTQTRTYTSNFYPRTFSGAGTAGATGAAASGNNAVLTGATATLASTGLNNQTSYPCTASANYCYVLLVGGSHTFSSGGFAFAMNAPTLITFTNQLGAVVTMYLYQATNSLTGAFTLVVTS